MRKLAFILSLTGLIACSDKDEDTGDTGDTGAEESTTGDE